MAVAVLAFSGLAAVPSMAQTADEAVRAAVSSGTPTRVIMQFGTTAARDEAFNRLLDRGAAVRATDTEAGPALVALGGAATFEPELTAASRTSIDAVVTASADQLPARAGRVRVDSSASEAVVELHGPSVAIIDSGLTPHHDLPAGRLRHFRDFVGSSTTPIDGCGHGTHVAGIVAGAGTDSGGDYVGIAPSLGIVVLRALGDDCSGNTSDVIDALTWVAQNHAEHEIKVVNLSLGHAVFESVFTDPLVQAVERLSRKGILVVAAAGNMGINPATRKPGYGGVGVPCNAPSALCVGSLDTNHNATLADDKVAQSSSRGPTRFDLLAKPDLVAPGVKIVSLSSPESKLFKENQHLRVFGRHQRPGTPAAYLTLSGTSMASPMAAGAAALVFTVNPLLSANAAKMILQFTASNVTTADPLTQGTGALNVIGALTLAAAVNPTSTIGDMWIRYAVSPMNLDASGNEVQWAKRLIYGDRYLAGGYAAISLARWDDNIVWGYDKFVENIVWGNDDNIVWGNNFDDNVVWGDNIVWGNTDVVLGYWAQEPTHGFWDDNIVWGNVTRGQADNIVWGNGDDNIVWGNCSEANAADNVVWGNHADNIVWGNCSDNIVWGNAVLTSASGGR